MPEMGFSVRSAQATANSPVAATARGVMSFFTVMRFLLGVTVVTCQKPKVAPTRNILYAGVPALVRPSGSSPVNFVHVMGFCAVP